MTIAQIETFDVVYPVVGHFKFFSRPQGRAMGRPTVVVKVTSDDGTIGWGQAVPSPRWSYETPESVKSTIDVYLAPALIGRDPTDVDAIHTLMNAEIAPSFSTGQPIAKAAIDTALFDLNGRMTNRSIAEQLGRTSLRQISLSWTINPASLDAVPAEVELALSRGYSSFNVKVGPHVPSDLELCRLVRQLAPQAHLWADANGGYEESAALEMLSKLADLGFAALEQPVPANRLASYQRLKRSGSLPILMDEGVVSATDLEEFVGLDLLDGVAMKLSRCGGFREGARMMSIIERHDLLFFGSGLTDPDISLAASLAFFGAFQLAHPAALNAPQFLSGSIVQTAFIVENGALNVPVGHGLGISIDEARIPKNSGLVQ
jgi:L-alanine-DL-glutamate epimerase-like enolase superfamily enzyme